MDFNAITFLWSVILNFPFLFIGNELIRIPQYSGLTWGILIYLGIFTGGLGYVLFFKGLQLMEASKGITIFYLKPIIATFLSFLLLHEVPGPSLYIGIVIEIVALFLVAHK
jgi:drug/metabolite transporter (DMT)-like permease